MPVFPIDKLYYTSPETMITRLLLIYIALGCLSFGVSAAAQSPSLVQGTLISPGGAPFHLKATITEGRDRTPVAEVEMYWIKPDLWRRSIVSDDFTQTLIVNGKAIYEKDSDDYIPLGLETLVTAMIGPVCYGANDCVKTKLMAAGHAVHLGDYREFDGKQIARRAHYTVSMGDFMSAEVTELEGLTDPDYGPFRPHPQVPGNAPIRIAAMSQAELLHLAVKKPKIIWPQALDGAETGQASFYLSIDPEGHVREVQPVSTANERTNDSAIRQMMRWKFRPPTKDGKRVQAEGLITLALNTRAFGPAKPLTNRKMRKMATNPVNPILPPGMVPPGTTFRMRVAVDSDGQIIEEIVTDGPPDLFVPCDAALKRWHFKPIMSWHFWPIMKRQARPYRGLVEFKF